MDHTYPRYDFEAEVLEEGTLKLPFSVAAKLERGQRVTVRLTKGSIPGALHRRNVTEDEIARISELQLEDRQQILRFLQAEGSLAAAKSFRRRASGMA